MNEQQLNAWKETQLILKQLIESEVENKWRSDFELATAQAEVYNPWFTQENIRNAFKGIIKLLEPDLLMKWSGNYTIPVKTAKNIGVIMAGNIPMAGFHDMLCVLLSGHNLFAKLSTSDKFLLPFLVKIVTAFDPDSGNRFNVTEQLKNMDAVIATGSNNTSRYFEYYFGKKPHIFRKNRNSAAVLTGDENEYDYLLLGRDIFAYFGLGCRNVSKLYVPENYSFDDFFNNLVEYSGVMQHTKYMNNFEYHQTLFLLNQKTFLTNNFLILTEDSPLSTPVSVVNYEHYKNENDLNEKLQLVDLELQCVVNKKGIIKPGQAQFPAIDDYADEIDTMAFLSAL